MKIYCNRRRPGLMTDIDNFVGKDIWVPGFISKRHKNHGRIIKPDRMYYIKVVDKSPTPDWDGQYNYSINAVWSDEVLSTNNLTIVDINNIIMGWYWYSIPENEIRLCDPRNGYSTLDIDQLLKEHSSRYNG